MRRLAGLVLVVALAALSPSVAVAQDEAPNDRCATIVGCPDAGPPPQDNGDRGGWAQLLTLGVLTVAVAFIMIKVFVAVRRADARSAGTGQPGS